MAAIASTDVTYTVVKKTIGESGYRNFTMTLAFGDGALTYPTGGIPLVAGKLGCPNQILSLNIFSPNSASGYAYKYDAVNKKILLYANAAHSHPLTLKNAAVADGATTRVNAGANLLGANTGSDITVAGGGANGGVQLSTALAASEVLSSVAPAATTLYVEVVGW